ncbi:MAG: hypothetical protein LBK99_10080 [Opitutaceae bacterium]|nr:hypothetical protein [Opitutaceae bacterium]
MPGSISGFRSGYPAPELSRSSSGYRGEPATGKISHPEERHPCDSWTGRVENRAVISLLLPLLLIVVVAVLWALTRPRTQGPRMFFMFLILVLACLASVQIGIAAGRLFAETRFFSGPGRELERLLEQTQTDLDEGRIDLVRARLTLMSEHWRNVDFFENGLPRFGKMAWQDFVREAGQAKSAEPVQDQASANGEADRDGRR